MISSIMCKTYVSSFKFKCGHGKEEHSIGTEYCDLYMKIDHVIDIVYDNFDSILENECDNCMYEASSKRAYKDDEDEMDVKNEYTNNLNIRSKNPFYISSKRIRINQTDGGYPIVKLPNRAKNKAHSVLY